MSDESGSDSEREGAESGGAQAVHDVIQAFGGIRPMASKLGLAVSTVQGWKNRDAIPDSRHELIRDTAERLGIELSPELLRASGDGSGEDEPRDGEREISETEDAQIVAEGPAADTSGEPAKTSDQASPAASAASSAATRVPRSGGGSGDGGGGDNGGTGDGGGDGESIPPRPHVIERPRPTGWVPGMLLGAAVLVLGAGSAVVLREHWLPMVGGAGDGVPEPVAERMQEVTGKLDSLRGRVNGLSSRVDDLKGQAGSAAKASAVDELRAELDALNQQLAKVEDQIAAGEAAGDGADSAALAQLNDTQDQLAKRLESLAKRQDALGNQQEQVAGRLDDVSARFDSATQRLDRAADRLDSLRQRMDKLEDSAATAEQLTALSERVDGLDDKLAKLADVADLKKTRQQAAKAARQAAARELGQAMAVVQLQDALRDSEPYAATLEAARKRLPDTAPVADALSTLAKHADSGVPTPDRLLATFRRRAGEAVAVSAGEQKDGLLTGVLRRLGDVIRVRPVGNQSGSEAGAILARAETKLEGRDLKGAVAEVESLSGPPAETMAPWLDRVRARMAADAAIETLRSEIIAPNGAANGNGDGA